MEKLRERYDGARTPGGQVISAQCDASTGQLSIWWIERRGRRNVSHPISVVLKPTAHTYEVTTFVDADSGKRLICTDLSAACAAIDEQIQIQAG